jgi:hypothetical protein
MKISTTPPQRAAAARSQLDTSQLLSQVLRLRDTDSEHQVEGVCPRSPPQLCKRHILANSSIDATIQRWTAIQVLTVLRFHQSLTKARLQSAP